MQVSLVEDDHVVEQISAHGLYPSFRRTVLPGAIRRDLLAPDAHVLNHCEDISPVLLVVVEDEVARRGIEREGFAKLLDDPRSGRVLGDADVEHAEGRLGMTLETVRSDTSKPSMSSSPWMRGAPQFGFSVAILRTRARTSAVVPGRPAFRRRDFQVL